MLSKEEKLNLIAEKIKECRKCENLLNRINVVPGQGNPNAKIIFLGEGPGEQEDKEGLAFVGRAGQLLTNILKAANINREDIYITNILKCRPPNNRKPTEEEAKNCRKYLDLQIKTINPKFIVCLGATAAQNLLGVETSISALRGTWYNYLNSRVLCTFHPSYALRQDYAKHEIYKDIMVVINELN